jgi:uncharacterized membrane protein
MAPPRTHVPDRKRASAGHETVPQAATPRWWAWTAFLLSLAGLGDSIYLTIDHFTGKLPVCAATGIVDCAKVTTSAESKFLGIPVALLGLLFFVAMAVVNFPRLWEATSHNLVRIRLAMVAVGMAFVIYLFAAELFLIKAICLWCSGVHLVTFALFVLVVSTSPAMAARTADVA